MTVWVGAFVWKYEGGLWALVQDSVSTDPRFSHQGVQIKLPGGMSEPEDSNSLATLRRELQHELELTLLPGDYKTGYDKIQDMDRKMIYLVRYDLLAGYLRTEPKMDGDSFMGAPRWLRVNEANEKFIFSTQRPGFHQAAKALQEQYRGLVI